MSEGIRREKRRTVGLRQQSLARGAGRGIKEVAVVLPVPLQLYCYDDPDAAETIIEMPDL